MYYVLQSTDFLRFFPTAGDLVEVGEASSAETSFSVDFGVDMMPLTFGVATG
jgi:hypothetical protein